MLKVLFVLLGTALIHGAKVGPFLTAFTTLNDNVMVADKQFFGNEGNSKRCGEFQIFCDWLFTDYKSQNNNNNYQSDLMEILKNQGYMIFFKKPKLTVDQPVGTRRCSGFPSVCKNLENLRRKNEIDQKSDTLNQL